MMCLLVNRGRPCWELIQCFFSLYGKCMNLSEVINSYMAKTKGLKEHCERCLKTERWNGKPVLMVVDAAFTSIGLNYFKNVVPKVIEFEKKFVENGHVQRFEELKSLSINKAKDIWANKRSWNVAKSVASYFAELAKSENLNDREALRQWAAMSQLENWEDDAIGKIKGVGINTYQYLRMMGGIDTAMPDKVVRKVIKQILKESATEMPTDSDIELVRTIERIALISGYKPIEICWMTWLIQSEGKVIRMEKYRDVLERI